MACNVCDLFDKDLEEKISIARRKVRIVETQSLRDYWKGVKDGLLEIQRIKKRIQNGSRVKTLS